MVKKEKPFQLAVRFSDTLFGVGNVVTRHNKIVEQFGSVYFGKMGQPISQLKVDKLNQQIEKEIPTFLYLVKGNRKRSTAYRAQLLHIRKELPAEDDNLLPPYYSEKDILQFMKVFMRIGEIKKIETAEIKNLKTISSFLPFTETLVRSSSGHFYVREKTNNL